MASLAKLGQFGEKVFVWRIQDVTIKVQCPALANVEKEI